MPNTPKGLTYPSSSSPVAVPADLQELATDVDGLIVPNTGGTYTGSVSFTQSPSVPTPTSSLHAVNKTYADAINADVTALETELGTNPSGTFSTVVQRLDSYTDGFNKVGNLLTANQASGTGGGWFGLNATFDTTTDSGDTVGRYTLTATGTIDFANLLASTAFGVGEVRTVLVDVKSSRSQVIRLFGNGYDAGWAGADNLPTRSITVAANTWTTIAVTATPATAKAYVGLILRADAGQSGDVILVRRASIHRGAAGVWSLPGTPVVGQSRIAVNNAVDLSGTGSPEGVVTAAPGSTWLQTDATTDVKGWIRWVKATGTGNTGWVAGPEADTGWRNVTASLDATFKTARPTAALYLRRVGSQCEARYIDSGSPSSVSGLIYDMPSGFYGSSFAKAVATMVNASTLAPATASMLVTYTSGQWLYAGGWGAAPYLGSVAWTTTQSWPTSLPGSAA